MGNFIQAREQFKASGKKTTSVNLYVIPESRRLRQVTVKLTPTSVTSQQDVIRSSQIQTADVWRYYSVQLPISAPGKWRLEVSSGHDHGCFVVEFSR